jgi:hypothetical protein
MINVIVPFSKPEFLNNTIQNFTQQTYKDKRLIIVENGPGIGCFKNTDFVVLSSGQHQSLAKNEAINWIRNHGGGWFSTFDCDDYYGSNYLEELSQNLDKAEIIGKHDRFLKTENDELILTYGLYENNYSKSIQGPTISARSEDCCFFKDVYNKDGSIWSGDDADFIADMTTKGARIYSTSRFNFMQCRYKSDHHVWCVYAKEIIQYCLMINGKAIKFDKLDLDVVNGINKDCNYSEVEKVDLQFSDIKVFENQRHN